MAAQVKKVVGGALTANADAPAGVQFVAADGAVLGAITLEQLGIEAGLLPPIVERLVVHAISQKVGDSYAGAADAENPTQYIKDAIAETIEQLLKGEWRVTTPGGIRVSLLARALARATGKTVEEAQAVVDHFSELNDEGKPSDAGKAWLKTMRANEQIKAHTAAIKLEDAEAEKLKLQATAAKAGAAGDLGALFQS